MAFWDNYDVLVTSVLLRPPVPVGFVYEGTDDMWEQYLRDGMFLQYFTPLGNVTGLPGISLPLHCHPDGLPIGVHVLGPPAGRGGAPAARGPAGGGLAVAGPPPGPGRDRAEETPWSGCG